MALGGRIFSETFVFRAWLLFPWLQALSHIAQSRRRQISFYSELLGRKQVLAPPGSVPACGRGELVLTPPSTTSAKRL